MSSLFAHSKEILSSLKLYFHRILGDPDYEDYDDNIAMESLSPKSFESFARIVPQSFSGFLHRTGELFSDSSDYGSKINYRSDEKKFASIPTTGNVINVMPDIFAISDWLFHTIITYQNEDHQKNCFIYSSSQ